MSRCHNIRQSRQHETTSPEGQMRDYLCFQASISLRLGILGQTVTCDGRVGRWCPHPQVSTRPPGEGRRRPGPGSQEAARIHAERQILSAFRNPRSTGVFKLAGFGAVTYEPIRKQTEQKNSFLPVKPLDGASQRSESSDE